MKQKERILIVIFAFGLFSSYAQESLNATGGNASGSGGTVAFSVGQVAYTTNTGTTASVAQGVQQAYVISPSGVATAESTNLILVFPNPVANNLTIQVEGYTNKKLMYQLFDATGKRLKGEQVEAGQTQVDMSAFAPATYFLHFIQANKKVQSFKIIKN